MLWMGLGSGVRGSVRGGAEHLTSAIPVPEAVGVQACGSVSVSGRVSVSVRV